MYGSVRTVVWEGERATAPPIQIEVGPQIIQRSGQCLGLFAVTLPCSGKVELEAVGVKNPDTAINALGELMQVMGAVVVVVLPGHAVILDFHRGAYIKKTT